MMISILLIIIFFLYMNRPYLKDAYVINLDTSKDRWNDVQSELEKLDVNVRRWSATNGKLMSDDDYLNMGIPKLLIPSRARENLQKKRKGEIGCYLSHKNLIEHLGKEFCLPNSGHLILEDDIIIDPECSKSLSDAFLDLPSDWDILFLGIIPEGAKMDSPRGRIAKVHQLWGTHAYIVRHGSIPKINREIKFMFDPIDEMLWQVNLNLYAVQPFSIHQRGDIVSDING